MQQSATVLLDTFTEEIFIPLFATHGLAAQVGFWETGAAGEAFRNRWEGTFQAVEELFLAYHGYQLQHNCKTLIEANATVDGINLSCKK